MIDCLRTRVRKQPINALYFESQNEPKLYNLEAKPDTLCFIGDTKTRYNYDEGTTLQFNLILYSGEGSVYIFCCYTFIGFKALPHISHTLPHVNNKGADQSAHPDSLMCAFVICSL